MAARPGRIGLFGGTFDPVHTGHVEAAQAVLGALHLDRMLLVVANEPWQKADRPITPAEDRFAMVVAASEGRAGLEPSRIEIDRGGVSYTIDTVRELRDGAPGAEVTLVVGSDVVADLPTWKDEAALRSLVTLAIVGRPGAPAVTAPSGWHTVDVPVAPFDVSSTELRCRIRDGLPVDGLVPDAVVRCILQRGLYATGR